MMAPIGHFYAGAVLLAGVLASIGIWAPRRTWIKAGAVAVTALFLPLGYLGLADLLGKPKPWALELASEDVEEARLVSAVMKEDVAIYVWLEIPGIDEPRAYALPWDEQTARELQRAQQDGEKRGEGVRMRFNYRSTLDERTPVFYAAPQEALPPKTVPEGEPLRFAAPADAT
jgi:hypothetical protein